MKERKHAGYTIIKSIKINDTPEVEYVLGENSNAPSPYVTWFCENGKNYYFGYYCSDKMAGTLDLYERSKLEISVQIMHMKNYIKEQNKEAQ